MPANPRRLVTESCGALQVMLCAVVLAGAAILLGYSRITAVVIGLTLAMSSTAVVIQVLSEEKRLNTVAGNASSAILLFRARHRRRTRTAAATCTAASPGAPSSGALALPTT